LPRRLFEGARLLEFGPDSGENSLAFATLGAELTLAEPNPNAVPRIKTYFNRFGLEARLKALLASDVEHFVGEPPYDIIDAEGFIYTLQPADRWLAAFNRLLRPGGLFVVSYLERYGGVLETVLKAFHAFVCDATGEQSIAAAHRLYDAKWASIPHTRAFESWVMDVLDNPFVRQRYFISATDLIAAGDAHGFALHSSWPVYRDPLSTYWHKLELSRDERLGRDAAHVARSRLSFFFGRQMFLGAADEEDVAAVGFDLARLANAVDRLIDRPRDAEMIACCRDCFARLRIRLAEDVILAQNAASKRRALDLLDSLDRGFGAMAAMDAAALVQFCGSDASFIAEWGMPTHFTVFRKEAEDRHGV
jgi:SAM-dependent methyltransferase